MNILNEESDCKFVTRNWNIINYQSNVNYSVGNEIIYSIEVSKSNLCDYNDANILAKCDIAIMRHNLATEVVFKNFAPVIKCITKTDRTTNGDAKDLDFVMRMHNLSECSSNYSGTKGSLWFCSKDEASNF